MVCLIFLAIFVIFDGSLYKRYEQRVRMEHGTAVFRMELSADIPAEGWDFYNFHQVGFGIDTCTLHASCFIFGLIKVVEFVAVAMAFLNVFGAIGFIGFASFLKDTFVSSQSHGAAHVGDGLLFFHDVDDVVGSLFVHFARISIGISQYVTGEFDGNALHTQTDAECRNIMGTGIFDGDKLAIDATFAETRTDEHTRHAFQGFGDVVVCQLFTVDEVYRNLAVVVSAGLGEGFTDRFVGIL